MQLGSVKDGFSWMDVLAIALLLLAEADNVLRPRLRLHGPWAHDVSDTCRRDGVCACYRPALQRSTQHCDLFFIWNSAIFALVSSVAGHTYFASKALRVVRNAWPMDTMALNLIPGPNQTILKHC